MKVRWTENSLRLRITPSELDRLREAIPVEARLLFPQQSMTDPPFCWRIVLRYDSSRAHSVLSADGDNSALILLALADMDELNEEDREGIYFPATDTGSTISYYIEKDFPCLHPRAAYANEKRTETFPAPPDFAARKA